MDKLQADLEKKVKGISEQTAKANEDSKAEKEGAKKL